MARPVWAGVLSFGLVSLPVGLYTATDTHTVHFHQLQRGTSDRIRNRRVNERTGEEVEAKDIVKGYDTGEEYVIVEPEELDDIAPGRSQTLEITGFVALDEIEPIYFDKTYYLAPRGKGYEKVYSLLTQALGRAEKTGVATFVMRQHEYLVAVKAEDGLLTLHTLHWADEIRDPRQEIDSLPGKSAASAKELKMAEQLIDTLSMKWDPEQFHDTFQEKVAALIEAKKAGESVEKAEPAPEPSAAVDLMEALRASLEEARSPKDTGAKAAAGSGAKATSGTGAKASTGSGGKATAGSGAKRRTSQSTAKKPAGKKRAQVSHKGQDPHAMNKAELYKKATAAGIEGRSSMTREQLIEALGNQRQAA